jgi:SRSO17 transposase
MSATSLAPGPQEKRFAAYIDGLATAAEHADRRIPLKNYCTGLLLPGERKSVEPLAARLAPGNVRRVHQSLHHLVADAPWSDEAMLRQVGSYVLPVMEKKGAVVAWIVDDTGFPKKGTHSVGVSRQYCGQVGKPENCRVAVSLSVATWSSSLPIAWRLYLPEGWAQKGKPRGRREFLRKWFFEPSPRSRWSGAPCGGVANHRMATAGPGADQVLVCDRTCPDPSLRLNQAGPAALDH